jgi:fructose transport system substrate-binding protein
MTLCGAVALGVLGAGSASAQTSACLITKTDTNPFFVKMKEGAAAAAAAAGIDLSTFAGKYDGDVETQVASVETCLASGAKGILITPTDSRALVPVVTQAREAGVLVIALDTQFEPADAADATFATDNFKAGVLIGEWAKATLGDDAANAKIALLDLNASEVSVDYQRDNGFLQGFGIDIKDPTDICRPRGGTSPRKTGQAWRSASPRVNPRSTPPECSTGRFARANGQHWASGKISELDSVFP